MIASNVYVIRKDNSLIVDAIKLHGPDESASKFVASFPMRVEERR